MSKENPFVKAPSEYVRNISIIRTAKNDYIKYLQTMTGRSYEQCKAFVLKQLSDSGKFPIQDPDVDYFERNAYGDRVRITSKFSDYLKYAVENEHLIAPTLTTYLNPRQKKSLLSGYIINNIALRDKAKHEMFAAMMAQNARLEMFKKGEQMNKKTLNNGISGSHVSSSNPLHNKSAHSTLTSNCRTTSAFGNANNEKLLAGNRHYWHPTVAINNVVSIANLTNLVELEAVMQKYQLHYPTGAELFECIMRSSRQYWVSPPNERRIEQLCERLKPIERAAVMYVGDLYHLKMYNDAFMRHFIGTISDRVEQEHDDPDTVVKQNRSEYVGLVVQLFGDMMKGFKISDRKEANRQEDRDRVNGVYKKIATNIEKIHKHILDMSDFIKAIFVTDNVPSSIAFLPDSLRHVALISDTDSTIFTVQDWVKWYTGSYQVNDTSNSCAATIIFLAAESITHILAIMSSNFGIEKDRIYQVAMKNEFKFDAIVPTMVGKHYFALIGCQEGNLLAKYKNEIKGVHLRNSNVAKEVIKHAEDMMVRIMKLALKAEPFHIMPFLKEVADLERSIAESIYRGERKYLKNGQIKTAASYSKDEELSPYQHYTFWNQVFASKYGVAPEPPYSCSKVSVNLKNQKEIKAWIETIKDDKIRAAAARWNDDTCKNAITTFHLPHTILQQYGIPEEIKPFVEIRRSILDVTKVFYLIMEALGIHMLNDKITRLMMDEY